jgi:hypothetical protein
LQAAIALVRQERGSLSSLHRGKGFRGRLRLERNSVMGKGNNAQKNDKKNKKPKQEKKPASK